MVRKVRLPLDMGNEVYVRTIEELKENYNSEKVTEYFLDGRLLTWLNDKYYEEEAEKVQELTEQGNKDNLAARLGKIFGIEIQEDVDVENLEIRREKLDKLRLITADDTILDNVDSVAFSQDELGDLLDNGTEVIYLCGEKFRIPLGVKNVRYIGVNKPVIDFGSKTESDFEANGITFEGCILPAVSENKVGEASISSFQIESEPEKKYENKDTSGFTTEAGYHLMCRLVDVYGYVDPKPMTPEQMKEKHINIELRQEPRIVLTTSLVNYTIKSKNSGSTNIMSIIRRQQAFMERTINEKGRLLYYQSSNNAAFVSGCLFNLGAEPAMPLRAGGNETEMHIFVKPEKYKDFINMFAVGTIVIMPCSDELSEDELEKIACSRMVTEAMPYIQIDMNKLFDYMCQYFNTDDKGIKNMSGFIYKLDMFELYMGVAWTSSLNECKYGFTNSVPQKPKMYSSFHDMVAPRWKIK